MQPTIWLVIPCYNEAGRLNWAAYEAGLAAHPGLHLLFVNDGSLDATATLLDAWVEKDATRLHVHHLPENRGKGEAVRVGMQHVARLAREASFVGYWDADLATPWAELNALRATLEAHPTCELALGARVQLLGRDIRRRPGRHYAGRVFATAVSLLLGLPIYDSQCGAKLFRNSPMLAHYFEQPFVSRWLFDVELLARMLQHPTEASSRQRFREVPLQRWHDVEGSKLGAQDMSRVGFDLWRIMRRYRPGLKARRRQHADTMAHHPR